MGSHDNVFSRDRSAKQATLDCRRPTRKSKLPSSKGKDPPDDRPVIAAYGREEIEAAAVIPAAAGYSLLSIYFDATRQVAGFSSFPVIAWRLVGDDKLPLPIVFGPHVPFHQMCNLAVRSPDGSVVSFEGGWFASSEEWLLNRQCDLGDQS
jgi:hypothetical protein